MIRKVKGGFKVLSEKTGKSLGGPYPSKKAAAKRLGQVEFFKHRGDGMIGISKTTYDKIAKDQHDLAVRRARESKIPHQTGLYETNENE